MDKKVVEMDESMKAMQRRLEEVEKDAEGNPGFKPGGNAKTLAADRDRMNPAAMAGAAGGIGGSGTDQESGGDSGASTGTGYHGHVGGTGTEDDF